MRVFLLFGSVSVIAISGVPAADLEIPSYKPQIAAASNDGERAIAQFRIPAGLKIDLVAAEPLLANPVCFCIDERGRIFVAETFRQQKGVEDNRNHMSWLDDDLAAETIADRLAMFQKHLKEKVSDYTQEQDRIRLLEDTDGDGKADRSTIFADGFNGIVDGTGAGLLARRGNVYYTCIPDLWLLRDNDCDGKADLKKSLHYGYGVRVAFRGHDMHGLRFGPDGKLYYSIGDRGYHVETEGRTLARPDTGAVFRCNPDGSDLEVFAYGLRNPQELVFDQYGNLFTGENNSDSGDQARWVYVVEGGDTGWRMYYQYLSDRGPWNREKLWHPYHEGQSAQIVPPIANLGNGPSGLTYDPGLGLPDKYRGHFFLCDFRGGSGNSGIRSFALEPNGATYKIVDSEEFAWSILATDADFGYDGALYISDWVDGWNGPGKGRIYKLSDPTKAKDPAIQEVTRVMAEGFAGKSPAELAPWLKHADMRVRQEAQFALADLGEAARETFAKIAGDKEHQLSRLHAIWGLGQLGRKSPDALEPVLPLLDDADLEVRAQAAKVLGDGHYKPAFDKLVALLTDENRRVRYFAAVGLGKLDNAQALEPIAKMLETNADQDPVLRHAGVMALTRLGTAESLETLGRNPAPAVRLGALLALRRQQSPKVAQFLNDPDVRLVEEAARAIHDEPITAAYPQLADLAARSTLSDSTGRRVISANFRLGESENAKRVAALAARADLADPLRIEAINSLGDWAAPSGRDRVLGAWRPLPTRPENIAADALPPALGGIFGGSDAVREAGTKVAAKLGVKEVGPVLFQLVADVERPAQGRAEALRALQTLKDPRLAEAVKLGLSDLAGPVRAAAQKVLAKTDPQAALETLTRVLQDGSQAERQSGFQTLAEMQQPEADALLVKSLDTLLAGQVPVQVQLDLLDAAARRKVQPISERLARFEAERPTTDPLAAYRETLAGGDAARGRSIFLERAQVSCVRCHKVQGQGGEVGPELTKIGSEKTAEYLLESLVAPNRQIAKGFETTVVATIEGKVHTGIVKVDNAEILQLLTAEGKLVTIRKDDIDERVPGKSSMPEDLTKHLSKSDLRDLVEFLSGLKPQ